MDYLYLDESGQFEGHDVSRSTFVGGLLTTSPPREVARVTRDLAAALVHAGVFPSTPEAKALHATEIRRDSTRLLASRRCTIEALSRLADLRLVSCRWFADTHHGLQLTSDAIAFNRFMRMWRTLVRHVAWFPWWQGGELTVWTAQRSFPLAELSEGSRRYADGFLRTRLGHDGPAGIRVAGEEQLPNMLRELDDAPASVPRSRPVGCAGAASISSATWERIDTCPEIAGLLLADLACDLIKQRPSGIGDRVADLKLQRWEHLDVAYSPVWRRLSDLLRWSNRSDDALAELLDLALGIRPLHEEDEIAAAGRRYAHRAVRAQLREPGTRSAAVQVAKGELATKTGRYPRTDLLFDSLPCPDLTAETLDEWVQRAVHANHRGSAGGEGRDPLEGRLDQLLDTDVDAALSHLESIAVLAVSYQDEFDFERAVEVAEPRFERARQVANLFPDARWTDFGRLASNLAQSLASRSEGDDLARASDMMHLARRHLESVGDLGQWACHGANIAALSGDTSLRRTTWTHLFGAESPEAGLDDLLSHTFDGTNHFRLFQATVVTRTALVGTDPFAAKLRDRLGSPDLWFTLLERTRRARKSHPLERYLRHLAELAPAEAHDQVEALAERSVHAFGNLDTDHATPLQGACTWATVALSRYRLGRPELGKRLGEKVLETLNRRFADNAWACPSVLCRVEGLESGWLLAAVERLEAGVTEDSLAAFVERFRLEWR